MSGSLALRVRYGVLRSIMASLVFVYMVCAAFLAATAIYSLYKYAVGITSFSPSAILGTVAWSAFVISPIIIAMASWMMTPVKKISSESGKRAHDACVAVCALAAIATACVGLYFNGLNLANSLERIGVNVTVGFGASAIVAGLAASACFSLFIYHIVSFKTLWAAADKSIKSAEDHVLPGNTGAEMKNSPIPLGAPCVVAVVSKEVTGYDHGLLRSTGSSGSIERAGSEDSVFVAVSSTGIQSEKGSTASIVYATSAISLKSDQKEVNESDRSERGAGSGNAMKRSVSADNVTACSAVGLKGSSSGGVAFCAGIGPSGQQAHGASSSIVRSSSEGNVSSASASGAPVKSGSGQPVIATEVMSDASISYGIACDSASMQIGGIFRPR